MSQLEGSLERMLEEETNALPYHTHAELMAGLWTTRVSGAITLASALVMIWRAWNRREGLFHRLVLGKFHLVVLRMKFVGFLRGMNFEMALFS